jgi:Tfp pilus assembly protein PilX
MTRALSHGSRRERGATLIIALIVLVAMSLAGIATMRSVDTSALVAGNIAFKESAVSGADQGIQAALAWLVGVNGNTAVAPTLYGNMNIPGVSSTGYYSTVGQVDKDWTDPSNWSNAHALNGGLADAAGNIVYYIVERLCTVDSCKPDDTCAGAYNYCSSTPDATTLSGEGLDMSRPQFFRRPPSYHYRVTARAVGPRNSVIIVQTHIGLR